MKKGDPTEVKSRPRKADSTTEAPSKIARILGHLLTGASLNRFEAERMGDHCLPSTIAVLANRHGLTFKRQPERVPNRWGAPCTVTRYSLPTSQRQHAAAVLSRLHPPDHRGLKPCRAIAGGYPVRQMMLAHGTDPASPQRRADPQQKSTPDSESEYDG